MATVHNYSVLRLLSMRGGLGLVGTAAFLNVHHAAESEGSYFSPVCIAIVALAFGSALAVPVMCALWRSGRRALTAARADTVASAGAWPGGPAARVSSRSGRQLCEN